MDNKEIRSPIKAIRAFCVECCGGSPYAVKECTGTSCVLYPFRFGKNPYLKREYTEEEKAEIRERFAKAREAHENK